MTEKQELARARNWLKFQLTGRKLQFKAEHVTWSEMALLIDMNDIIDKLNKSFDKSSIDMGLKIPEHRCFFDPCRNKAKYKGIVSGRDVYFCKKHFEEYLEIYNK